MPEVDERMLAGASSGRKPPLLYYGWPITEKFLLEYAKRHQIVSFTTLHGKKLEYAALTPEDLQDKEFEVALIGRAQNDVFKHLGQRSGYTLEIARPFTDQYFCMVALYSNYSMKRRYPVLLAAGLENVVCELDHAIKEVDPDTDLQWWYDWNNNLVSEFLRKAGRKLMYASVDREFSLLMREVSYYALQPSTTFQVLTHLIRFASV